MNQQNGRQRWDERHSEEAQIALGLRRRGFSTKQILAWLRSEGVRITHRTLAEFFQFNADPDAHREKLRRHRERERARRLTKAEAAPYIANRERSERRALHCAIINRAVERWFTDPDFNPGIN